MRRHRLIKTRITKSTLDAGKAMRKTMLKYKLLHFSASILLPLAILPWSLPEGMGVLSLIGALCLGSSAGLLAVSMPIAVPLVPIMAFSIEWDPLLSSSTNSLLAAALSMGLAGLTWRRHLAGHHSALMDPFGAFLDGMPFPEAHAGASLQVKPVRQRSPGQGRCAPAPRAIKEVLAAVLGPSYQTIRQLYGPRTQWQGYTVFAAAVLGLLCWGIYGSGKRNHGVFFAAMWSGLFAAVMQRRAKRLHELVLKRGAQWGELMLMPGLPGLPGSTALTPAVMRQVITCLVERMSLISLGMAAGAALLYPVSPAWLFWWVCFSGLLLLHGTASAALAWQRQGHIGHGVVPAS